MNRITNQKDLRKAFWERANLDYGYDVDNQYRVSYRQNDYSATVRCDWVDFIDRLQREGTISEALAQRATL